MLCCCVFSSSFESTCYNSELIMIELHHRRPLNPSSKEPTKSGQNFSESEVEAKTMKALPQTEQNDSSISFSSTVESLFDNANSATRSPAKERLLLSLADIYEGALRKVLNLQLNLKIEEQPRLHNGNDVTEKHSPPRPTALRMENEKHRGDYRHRRHKSDEENDLRGAPQGHNVLRKLGERSTAEGSAFHVPSKRRCDMLGYPTHERETDYPIEHYGISRHSAPDFPVDYGHSHYHPHLYGPRMDPLRRARLAPSYLGPRGVVHDSYSRLSRHQRDVPPLFPVRCSSVERDSQTGLRSTELTSRDYKYPDSSLNDDKKYPNMKTEKEENDKIEETFNKANDHLTHHKAPNSPRLSPERKSPHSERFQPYIRRTRPSPPANGTTEINGEDATKTVENVVKRETKKEDGEEGEKEEFLSNLGLARIF